MKIIAINGSHRGTGEYTHFLIEKLFEGAKKEGATCEEITLSELNINICKGCGVCNTEKHLLKCIYEEEDYIDQEPKNFSYPPYRKILPNLNLIKNYGLEEFVKQLEKRIELLKIAIKDFNDGRSRGLLCWAAALADVKDLKILLNEAQQEIKQGGIDPQDIESKARIMKKNIYELFEREKIQIKKR